MTKTASLRSFTWALAILVAAGGCGDGRDPVAPEVAAPSLLARGETPSLRLHRNATVTAEGELLVAARLRCAAGTEILEAFVTASQQDPEVFGDGPILGVPCDGRPHRAVVRLTSLEGAFHEGEAFASGFVLACTAAGDCLQAQDAHPVRVRVPRGG